MDAQIDTLNLPRAGRLQIDIHLSADMNISATVARRKANAFTASNIGNLLLADEPTLTISDRIVWRVPVDLTYPHIGRVSKVGTLDVDAETGVVLVTAEQVTKITERAKNLAQRTLTAAP